MERRGLKWRKGVLRGILPLVRCLPLPTACGVLTGLGRLEFALHPPLQRTFRNAVAAGNSALGCHWDLEQTSRELAGNQVLWRSRDLILDGVSDRRASAMFQVSGQEYLDAAIAQRKGCLVLTSHFGAHMLPAHWLYRQNYPLRLYMERPRSISRYIRRQFQGEGPHSQEKLFISRRGGTADAAGSILRAARVLRDGLLLFLAGDVRWSGQMTEPGRLLGRTLRFSSTWVILASMTAAPVVPVFCVLGEDRRFHVAFYPPLHVPREAPQEGQAGLWVQRFLDLLESQIRLYPGSSNDFLFWDDSDGEAA